MKSKLRVISVNVALIGNEVITSYYAINNDDGSLWECSESVSPTAISSIDKEWKRVPLPPLEVEIEDKVVILERPTDSGLCAWPIDVGPGEFYEARRHRWVGREMSPSGATSCVRDVCANCGIERPK